MLDTLGKVLYWVGCLIVSSGTIFARPVLAAEAIPAVEIIAMRDGSIELEGTRFTDAVALKVKLTEIKERIPTPEFQFRQQDGANFREIAPAIVLLQDAGVLKRGFTIFAPNPATKP